MGTKLEMVAVLGLAVWMTGCGSIGWSGTPAGEGPPEFGPSAWEEAPDRTGPRSVSGSEPDTSLSGVQIFAQRGCTNCHSIGEGVVVGPDLEGVTERRAFGWFQGLVTNPDSMLRTDPTAMQLRTEYGVSMPDLDIGEDEARALYAFLEDPSRSLAEDPAGSESTTAAGGCPHCRTGEGPLGGCGECPRCESGACPHQESGDCPRCSSGECAHCGSGESAGDGPGRCHGGGKMCSHHGSMGEGHGPEGKMADCGHKHDPRPGSSN